MSPIPTKEQIAERIEAYHQDHFYEIFPAGKVQPWIYDAVAEYLRELMEPEETKTAVKSLNM